MSQIAQALKSRTVLFGLMLTVASVAQIFVPYLPHAIVGPAGAFVGVSVIVLRFLTSVPVSQK